MTDTGESFLALGFHLPSYIPGADLYNERAAPMMALLFQLNKWFADVTGIVGDASIEACKFNPLCDTVLKGVTGKFSDFALWMTQNIMPNLLLNLTGGRAVDTVAMGFDVMYNGFCQEVLGCAQGTDAQAAQIQSKQVAEARQEFQSQPLASRLFSTDSQYSLVSRLALAMPTSWLTAVNNGVASLATDPLSRIGSTFSGIFSAKSVFADPPMADMFHQKQSLYTDQQLASIGDQEQFLKDNCTNGPLATYDDSTKQYTATTDWLNSHTTQDPDTLQPVYTATNPCLLIQTATQLGASMFSTTGLSAGSLNPDPNY
jgi:hypothetical protein